MKGYTYINYVSNKCIISLDIFYKCFINFTMSSMSRSIDISYCAFKWIVSLVKEHVQSWLLRLTSKAAVLQRLCRLVFTVFCSKRFVPFVFTALIPNSYFTIQFKYLLNLFHFRFIKYIYTQMIIKFGFLNILMRKSWIRYFPWGKFLRFIYFV